MNRGNKASSVIDTIFVEAQELTNKKQIPGTIGQTDTCPIDNIAETNKRFSFKYIQPTYLF